MRLTQAKRIVIKIGSSLIVEKDTGHVRRNWLEGLAYDIALCKQRSQDIIIVTSGSVALGKKSILTGKNPLKLREKQAAAACGQMELMHNYQTSFTSHGLRVAQILMTIHDSENRRCYLNARDTIETLASFGIVPIINENDTIATSHLRVGDNDRLAARISQMVGADLLILLSDIDGLYTDDPHRNPKATHIPFVGELDEKIECMARSPLSAVGTGGMVTKIAAAKITMASGCHMMIANGIQLHPLKRLEDGERNTLFIPSDTPMRARKKWILTGLHTKGELMIDDGAIEALYKGRSLLPAGVTGVKGDFDRGDAVIVRNRHNKEIGRGLCAYPFRDAVQIIGKKSSEVKGILGFTGRDELIHRSDLALHQKD